MQKGGQVAAAPDATVSFNRRNGPGMSEIHEKETDTAGTPHWFKRLPKSGRYYTVKAIRP